MNTLRQIIPKEFIIIILRMQILILTEVGIMVQLVQLRDSLIGFIFLLFVGCENAPLDVYKASAVSLETKRGITSNDGVPFSGIVLERFSNSQDTLLIQEYREGKPGVFKRFYENNLLFL